MTVLQLLRVPVLHAHVLFLLLVMCMSSHPHLLLTFLQVREHNQQVHDDVTVIGMKNQWQQKLQCGNFSCCGGLTYKGSPTNLTYTTNKLDTCFKLLVLLPVTVALWILVDLWRYGFIHGPVVPVLLLVVQVLWMIAFPWLLIAAPCTVMWSGLYLLSDHA